MVASASHLVTGPIPSVSSAVCTGKAIEPKVSPYTQMMMVMTETMKFSGGCGCCVGFYCVMIIMFKKTASIDDNVNGTHLN